MTFSNNIRILSLYKDFPVRLKKKKIWHELAYQEDYTNTRQQTTQTDVFNQQRTTLHHIDREKKGRNISFLPTLLRRLTPTLWACTEPAIVIHGTPMNKDSQVVVVPAYGNVSKLQKWYSKVRTSKQVVNLK